MLGYLLFCSDSAALVSRIVLDGNAEQSHSNAYMNDDADSSNFLVLHLSTSEVRVPSVIQGAP
jgi:hypothetical protein